MSIVEYYNRSLKKYSRCLELSHAWAQSFMSRLGFVKRKGTKAAQKLPDDTPTITLQFMEKIKNIVTIQIPGQLAFNCDHTGTKLVPASDWTMAEEGSKQVEVRGLDDKRDVTASLTATLSGQLLSLQLLYAGKTPRCYPCQSFPSDWDIYHSPTHCSTEDTMLRFVKNIIIYTSLLLQNALAFLRVKRPLQCLMFLQLTGLLD